MFVCRIHCWVEEIFPQSLRGCHRETVKQTATLNTTIEAGLVIIAETHVKYCLHRRDIIALYLQSR